MTRRQIKGNEKIGLNSVFSAISEPLRTVLTTTTTSVTHPVSKGDASEYQWLQWLKNYLPKRYEVNKGFVVDSEGNFSEQQDIIIYDRQYSPYLLNKDGIIYVPAESVYAVVEVKQELSKAFIKYAGDKIKSVRCLKRTSVPIPWADGKLRAKSLHRIIGCLVCLKNGWKKGIVDSRMMKSLENVRDKNSQIDLICCLNAGSLVVSYKNNAIGLEKSTPEASLTYFFLKLMSKLQELATAPAMDFNAYSKTLKNYELPTR